MTDRVDNDTALEEVLEFLEAPPIPGSPDDTRFAERLRQVLAASIADDPEDEDAPVPKADLPLDDDLRRRLEQVARHHASNPFGDHPDGIGPTLGMDLSKS